jgi:sugar phosphate isomerase/epimerase
MELGLVFWAEHPAETILRQLRDLALYSGQLGVPPQLDCGRALEEWTEALSAHQVNLSSVVCAYQGEDYSSLDSVHATVGFTTPGLRADRMMRTQEVIRFARALGILSVSCHIGFIPEDPREALFQDLVDLTRSLCDQGGTDGQNFVLETGQESAQALLAFIQSVDRPNLKVNFDPANMIMYGSGDPLAALKLLSPHILSVHCKDAHSPIAGSGLLGSECRLGDGEVDFPAFLKQLKGMHYQGPLSIEREESNQETRLADIRIGISRLEQWKAELA